MRQTISIRLKNAIDRSYRVTIEPGIFQEVPQLVFTAFGNRDFFIVTDSTVAALHGRRLLRGFARLDARAIMVDFRPGEASKNAHLLFALQTQLLSHGIRRDSLILAVGGGVVGDVAGFAAATVLRGVTCVQVPTSLLAQVDSSIGGKVGIDHPIGKNLIGAFLQPAAVFVDPEVLRSLPLVEFRNGLAETVKIAAALDRRFFATLERRADRIRKSEPALLADLIARSVGLKAAVVEQDEFETGIRKALNVGHTIGHAIESASHFTVRHGAAVAMGMAAEGRIAADMGLLPHTEYNRLVLLLHRLGLPTRIPRIRERERFLAALAADKKGTANGAKFVLLRSLGQTVIGVDVPMRAIMRVVPLP